MADWSWSAGAHRYREASSGRFLSPTAVLSTRNDFLSRRMVAVQQMTAGLTDGTLSVQAWEKAMQTEIQRLYGAQYIYGRGGKQAATDADWQAAADLARGQMTYLRGFAEEVAAGDLSAGRIQARAALYASGAVQAFEAGKTASYAGLVLPHQPGDGSTPCLSQCRCSWAITPTDGGWDCTWQLHGSEACSGCSSRASQWAPLVVARQEEIAA